MRSGGPISKKAPGDRQITADEIRDRAACKALDRTHILDAA